MAYATQPIVVTQAAAVVGNAASPAVLVPENCHTIILLNTSGANPVLFGQAPSGLALVEGTTGTRLPAGSSISLAIGTVKQRGFMDDTVTGPGIVFTAIGGAVNVDITYLCGFGSI